MKYAGLAFAVVVVASLFPQTGLASPPTGKPGVKKESFGTLPDGTPLRTPSMPWRFSTLETRLEPAPQPGQHTDDVKAALRQGRWPAQVSEAVEVG